MRKKIMAVALGIALCGSLLSGCTKTQESVENQETQTAQETPGLNGQEETAEAPTEIEAEADPEEEERNRQDVSTIGDRTRLYVMIPENSGASGREAEVIRATGEAAGYTVTIEEHEGNIHRQQTFFQEAMEDENTAAIICDHAGATKTADMVAEAKAAGIPTVLINTGIDVEGSAVAQILTDSYASVTEASRRYLEHLGSSGLYVEILGDTWNINAFQATTAFHDVASEYGDLLMDRQAIGSEYDLEDSKEKITRMLEESPDSKEAAEKNSGILKYFVFLRPYVLSPLRLVKELKNLFQIMIVKEIEIMHARNRVDATKKYSQKYVRYQEGAEKYSLGVSKFMELAKEAKAVYKIDKIALVNCDLFEAYLETFREY